VVLVFYLFIRRKERLALLEKGQSASIFESRKKVPVDLKWGMLFVGIGIGILIGRILIELTSMGEEESFFSMVFLFGGLSLVIYHFIAGRLEKKNREN